MKLIAISNHLQIYGDKNGDKFLLINKREKSSPFRQMFINKEDISTMRNLLGAVEPVMSEHPSMRIKNRKK